MKASEPNNAAPSLFSRTLRIGHKPIGFKVARGVVSSVLRKLLVAPISLLLVPFTLHKIGVAGYGTWAILSTIISLVWLMDPGLGPTVTKFVAELSGTNDIHEIQRVLDASCAICLFMSALASVVVWSCSHWIIGELFRGPAAPTVSAILPLWPLVLLCMSTFLMTAPFLALINGRQRMDLTNLLIVSAEIFSALATVVLLFAGLKIVGLLIAQFASSLFILVGAVVIARRLLPSVVVNPFRCKLAVVRKIGTFSIPLYAGYVMTTLQGQLERLYLARMVGIVPVGWYSVASQGAAKVRRLPDLLLGPVLAAASELEAGMEWQKLEELHFRAHKYLALTAVPLVVFAAVSAKALMRLWVGNDLQVIALTFAILVIGNLFPQAGSPTYFIMVGRGILRPAVYAALLATVLNVVLSYIFIKQWGFPGAALGTALAMIINTIYFFVKCRPYFQTPLYETMRRAYLKPFLCSIAAVSMVPAISLLDLRIWKGLLVEMVAFGLVYLIGLAMTGFFDRFDLANVETHLPFLLRYRGKLVPAGIIGAGIKGAE
jgi:O-antigen/teichoic acid export membrane protein